MEPNVVYTYVCGFDSSVETFTLRHWPPIIIHCVLRCIINNNKLYETYIMFEMISLKICLFLLLFFGIKINIYISIIIAIRWWPQAASSSSSFVHYFFFFLVLFASLACWPKQMLNLLRFRPAEENYWWKKKRHSIIQYCVNVEFNISDWCQFFPWKKKLLKKFKKRSI